MLRVNRDNLVRKGDFVLTEHVEAVVIGAGVVGLAVARELALAGKEVIVLEAADSIGTETSSGIVRSSMQVFTIPLEV